MTANTGISADRKHSTIACRAMDSALNAARYIAICNDLGNFDPRRASHMRRNFDQYKRAMLRKNRVPSDAELLDSIDRLIDSGDIAGVQNAADRWLGVL